MRQQDKLRDTLREYFDTQQAPFSDKEWERASAYLSAARRKRRIRYSVLILGALLSLLFTVVNFPAFITNAPQASPLSYQKLKSPPAKPSVVQPITVISNRNKGGRANPHPKGNSDAVQNVISSPAARRTIPEVQNSVPTANALQFPESLSAASVQTSAEEKTMNEATAMDAGTVTSTSTGSTDRELPEERLTESREHAKGVPESSERPAHDQNGVPPKEMTPAPIPVLLQITGTTTLNNTKEAPAAIDKTKRLDTQETQLPALVDTSQHLAIAGTTATDEPSDWDTLPRPTSHRLAGEGLFYEAGAAWLYGWKDPVTRDARGFSPVAGINYMNRLTSRYALSFGLQYLRVSNLSNSSKTSRVSSYLYGEQSRVTVITPLTLHYLVAPLRFHYYVNHRHSFGAGIHLAYLLNVDATVTSYDERSGFTGNYKTVKQGGYTEGFSWFDSQLAFFYRRSIGGSLALQAEIFMGLTDVKQDAFFSSDNKERNSGVKLSLVYYAFRKNNGR